MLTHCRTKEIETDRFYFKTIQIGMSGSRRQTRGYAC